MAAGSSKRAAAASWRPVSAREGHGPISPEGGRYRTEAWRANSSNSAMRPCSRYSENSGSLRMAKSRMASAPNSAAAVTAASAPASPRRTQQGGAVVERRPGQGGLAQVRDQRLVPRQAPLRFGHVGELHGRLEAEAEGAAGQDRVVQSFGELPAVRWWPRTARRRCRGVDRVVAGQEHGARASAITSSDRPIGALRSDSASRGRGSSCQASSNPRVASSRARSRRSLCQRRRWPLPGPRLGRRRRGRPLSRCDPSY